VFFKLITMFTIWDFTPHNVCKHYSNADVSQVSGNTKIWWLKKEIVSFSMFAMDKTINMNVYIVLHTLLMCTHTDIHINTHAHSHTHTHTHHTHTHARTNTTTTT